MKRQKLYPRNWEVTMIGSGHNFSFLLVKYIIYLGLLWSHVTIYALALNYSSSSLKKRRVSYNLDSLPDSKCSGSGVLQSIQRFRKAALIEIVIEK